MSSTKTRQVIYALQTLTANIRNETPWFDTFELSTVIPYIVNATSVSPNRPVILLEVSDPSLAIVDQIWEVNHTQALNRSRSWSIPINPGHQRGRIVFDLTNVDNTDVQGRVIVDSHKTLG